MKAWRIFVHSVRQVFGNFGDAVRVSGLIYIAQVMVAVALGIVPGAFTGIAEPATAPPVQLLAAAAAFTVASLWIAVAWHRFVLSGEGQTGVLPPFRGDRIWAYFLKSVLVALASVAVGIVTGMVTGIVFFALLGQSPAAAVATTLVTLVAVLVVVYRLSAALPGVALGQATGLRAAWEATRGDGLTVFGLALITGVASILLGLPLEAINAGSNLALAWEVAMGWVQLMVGVSVLTTLYGHYFEKRALV